MNKFPEHIHTPNDGRGLRDVFLNGKLIEGCVYADTQEGIVRCHILPLRLDESGNIAVRQFNGKVEVKPQ